MKQKKIILSVIFGSVLFFTQKADAVGISFSDKTEKPSIIFNFKGRQKLPFNLSVSGGIDFAPLYSDIVGDNSSVLGNQLWSVMGSAQANLEYNLNLIKFETPLGNFDPTLSPYVGYKHFWSHTGSKKALDLNKPDTLFSNIGGVNYGLRFTTNLPLGLFGYAEAGATSLLNGGWEQENNLNKNSGNLNGESKLLPHAAVGASLSLFNLASVYAGYSIDMIPDIRETSKINNQAMVQSFNVGLRVLFFSI